MIHPLRERHSRLYGFDFQGLRIMVSGDGVTWEEHEPPGPVYDLVVDPDDETHLIASTDQGLVEPRDDGERWRPLAESATARLAWASDGRLFIVEPNGTVTLSDDGGVSARTVGTLGGPPAGGDHPKGQQHLRVARWRVDPAVPGRRQDLDRGHAPAHPLMARSPAPAAPPAPGCCGEGP